MRLKGLCLDLEGLNGRDIRECRDYASMMLLRG